LEYFAQSWRLYLNRDILQLEMVQHRTTKCITKFKKTNYRVKGLKYEDRLLATGLTTLKDRRGLIQVFKIIKGIDKVDHNKFFKLTNTDRTRGHSFK